MTAKIYTFICINKDKIRPGFEIHDCEHMQLDLDDFSMEYEHYKCMECGKTDKLDYEEMK